MKSIGAVLKTISTVVALLVLLGLLPQAVLPRASAAPAAPTNLTATMVNSSRIDLAWTAHSSNQTGFHILTATDANFTQGAMTLQVTGNVTSYSDTTVYGGATFYYKVTAYDATGDSAPSNVASVFIPLPNASVPPAPSLLTVTVVSPTNAGLSWTDNSASEVGFIIDRANDSGFATVVTFNVGPNVTTYNDLTTVAGQTYYYRVSAFNALGKSSPSNTASTAPQAPAAPSGLAAVAASPTLVNLSWTNNASNQTGLRIERATNSSFTGKVSFQVGASAAAYADNSTAAGTTYYYRIFAFNAVGDSPASGVATVTIAGVAPAAPGNLIGTAVGTQVNLAWVNNANNQIGFRIERAASSAFTGATSFQVGGSVTTYTDGSTQAGATYYYRVFAFNAVGSSSASNTVTVTIPAASSTLSAPSNLTATLVNTTRIDLAWTSSGGGAGFHIESATDAAFATGQLTITVGPVPTTYSDGSVYPGATFYYRVKAFNANGDSPASNVASVFIPLATATVPASPTGLTVSAVSASQANLSWFDNSGNEVGFLIERAADSGFSVSPSSFTVGPNVRTYSDITTVAGATYYYRIVAFNALGNSQPSNVASTGLTQSSSTTPITSTTVPSAPAGLSATASAMQVSLTWVNAANNEAGFRIERSTSPAFTLGLSSFQVAAATTAYADSSAAPANTYYYRVFAFNAAGESVASNVAVVITPALSTAQPASTAQPPVNNIPGNVAAPAPMKLTLSGLSEKAALRVDNTGMAQGPAQLVSNDGKAAINVASGTRLMGANGSPLRTIAKAEVAAPPAPPAGRVILASSSFGPDGARFDPPITLTMKYDVRALPAGASEDILQIATWDGTQWQMLESTVNTLEKTVSAAVKHFSQFSVMGKVVSQPPSPASFSISGLKTAPRSSRLAEKVVISVNVANEGGIKGTYKVVFKIDDLEADSQEITLTPGEKQVVSFTTMKEAAGSYKIDVNGLGTTLLVSGIPMPTPTPSAPPPRPAPAAGSSNWWIVWLIGAVGVAGGAFVYLKQHRRKKQISLDRFFR